MRLDGEGGWTSDNCEDGCGVQACGRLILQAWEIFELVLKHADIYGRSDLTIIVISSGNSFKLSLISAD